MIVDNVEIPFDPDWHSIAISVSGGADSALLAFLLCNEIVRSKKQVTVHIISHIRMWKTRPWQRFDSLRVFYWLRERFETIRFVRHENFISPALEWGFTGPSIKDEYGTMTSGDIIEIQSFAEFVCIDNYVQAYYNAVTRNPKGVDFQGMSKRDIDPTDDNEYLRVTEHLGVLACHPFRFIDKSWVIKQYKDYNLDDLLLIARSCEGEFEGIDYKSYTPAQHVPVCGECFWCKERTWAIEQNEK